MLTSHIAEPKDSGPPSPFPEGWYFIASRKAVQRARLLEKTWMGKDIIVWCDDAGNVCVAEAACPHLGAHLGPAAGGRVRDGRLVCAFHGFAYDAGGQCVATPYAPAPRAARLRVFETQEMAGLIFAWWGLEGRRPQWRLPEHMADQSGWSGVSLRTLRFPGHPQETTENSVDLGHLQYVHGYRNVDRVGPVEVDGAYLRSDFTFRRRGKALGVFPVSLDVSAHAHIYGLGFSFVVIRESAVGMDSRLWVMATPVDGAVIDLSLASQVRELRRPRGVGMALRLLPTPLRAPIVNWFVAAQQQHDVLQDVAIWRRKQYRALPRLSASDGEIMEFRAYCAQFYPGPDAPADPAPAHESAMERSA